MESVQQDDFLMPTLWRRLRKHADELTFPGVTNPADGVFYPGIDTDIPEPILEDLYMRMGRLHGGATIVPKYTFLRLSKEGEAAPHIAHCDRIMADWAFFLYMNRDEHCQGGTALVRHVKGGFDRTPLTPRQAGYVVRDENRPAEWEVTRRFDMKPNRGIAIRSTMFHWAEPVDGFGAGPKDGRLILIVFHDLA